MLQWSDNPVREAGTMFVIDVHPELPGKNKNIGGRSLRTTMQN
jgi:hypothetical protein